MNNDLISRSALLNQRPEYLNPDHVDIENALFAKGWNACNSEYYSLITASCTVDAEPVRHGVWEKAKAVFHKKCSYCKCILHMPRERNYCPNCGAKMVAEVEG